MIRGKILVGPLPPPIGGVSTHVKRTMDKLHIPCINTSHLSFSDIRYILMLHNKEIIVHDYGKITLLVLILKASLFRLNCEITLVNHNFGIFSIQERDYKSTVFKYLVRALVGLSTQMLVVNDYLKIKMCSMYKHAQIKVFDPFIEPDMRDEERIRKTYPPELLNFIKSKKPLLSAGAWHLTFFQDHELYGFDMLIELIGVLKLNYSNIGLVFGLADIEFNQPYLCQCIERIKQLKIEDNVCILKDQKEIWPIIKDSDVFLRPTNTDGDPLSIKEALAFNVPVVASDCVKRDTRVRIFLTRDIDSLVNVTNKVLEYMKSGENCA